MLDETTARRGNLLSVVSPIVNGPFMLSKCAASRCTKRIWLSFVLRKAKFRVHLVFCYRGPRVVFNFTLKDELFIIVHLYYE